MIKTTIKTVALLAVLSVSAVGCQKETITVERQTGVELRDTVYTVRYSINGVTHTERLFDKAEYDALLLRLLALAREGYDVVIVGGNSMGDVSLAKEVVTYTTKKEVEAVAWTKQKIDEGYTVQMSYDQQTGEYTCIAYR